MQRAKSRRLQAKTVRPRCGLKVNIQIQSTAKPLDQGHRASLYKGFCKAPFMCQVRGDAAAASQRSVNVATIQYQEGSITFNTLINTLAANTQQQDLLSATQGNVATSLVQVYKALGGGWEIRNGQDPVDLLPELMKEEMLERTGAWEGVLD